MTLQPQGRRDDLLRLFSHAYWANEEIFKVLQGSDVVSEKLMSLFSHLLTAEKVWLERLNQRDSTVPSIWPTYPPEDCGQLLRANAAGYHIFIIELKDEDLDSLLTYRTSKGIVFNTAVVDILHHVSLHGSYHRGQISTYLRLDGLEPVNTDFIMFARRDPE
ncbi:DinB family protein [Paenibacillus sp. GCM10012306]|uniref:DinB family protein n=1 Tax=Paenibacillus sp. GCM10012306 TaxID=3317342 RepID=UPI003610E42D